MLSQKSTMKTKLENMYLQKRISYGYRKVINMMLLSGVISIIAIGILFANMMNYVNNVNAADQAVKTCRININTAARNIREMALNDDESTYDSYEEKVKELLDKLSAGEAENSSDLDYMAGIFGEIMAEILAWREDEWKENLRRMGFFLGKFIYLCDAYEDLEEDLTEGRYNPLTKLSEGKDFEENCRGILTMMAAECSREFEKLPIIEYTGILRNILYSGIWVRYEKARKKRTEEKSDTNKKKMIRKRRSL